MKTEYEAKFLKINKDEIVAKLKEVGAELVYPEFLQKRVTFNFPKGHEMEDGWLRIRKEADKITLSLKFHNREGGIEGLRETQVVVNDFDYTMEILMTIGCERKSLQENMREIWKLGEVEVAIDKWPFMETYIELEGASEAQVKEAAEKLGFNYDNAYFGNVDGLFAQKYGISTDKFNFNPELKFSSETNPLLN